MLYENLIEIANAFCLWIKIATIQDILISESTKQ